MKPSVHFLTFATKNWVNANERMRKDMEEVQNKTSFFKSIDILTEDDLGDDWNSYFSKYTKDHAYAYWSWKPYIILRKLKQLKDGEVLLYIDGGCKFPTGDETIPFVTELENKVYQMQKSNSFMGISKATIPRGSIVRNSILKFFGLENDNEFVYGLGSHYRAGLLLLIKTDDCMKFIETWYETMRDNYEQLVHPEIDKDSELPMFYHNGGDQAILHCLLYINPVKLTLCNDLFSKKFNLITRLRG